MKIHILQLQHCEIILTMINRRDKVCTKIKVHKNVRDRPFGFEIYLVNVKTMRTIAQIFVAFSEKLNFNNSNYLTC